LYIEKYTKLRATLAQLFGIFGANFATNFAQLLDFLSATFWGDYVLNLLPCKYTVFAGIALANNVINMS